MEFMLACWLVVSPFIFRYHTVRDRFFWLNDAICASLIALFAMLSFWPPLRKIHLLNLGVAFWLMGVGYHTFPELALVPEENSFAMGLFILMLSIVPCHAHLPPRSWQKLEKK
jgi:hypothetical protein